MDEQTQKALSTKYLEFKNTCTKIGIEEATVQYRSIGQQDWRLEVLCELYLIFFNVQNETTEKTNKNIRSLARLLNSEAFFKENGNLVSDLIVMFDEIEYNEGNATSWKYLLEGAVHLPTRLEVVQGLAKSNEIFYEDVVDHLLHCVHKLDSRYSIHLSEMIYKVIEEHPEYVYTVRFKLMEMQILPDLITRLTVIYCQDIVEFLNGVFFGKSTWYLVQSVNSGQYFVKMKYRIIKYIEENFQDGNPNSVPISVAIRALSGMVGYFGIKLNETEVSLCIRILNKTKSERLVQLMVCLILISADQFLKKQNELSQVLGHLLQSEISELPILILVYFQTDAIQQIEDTIRSILSMRVPIPKLGLFEIQKLFRSLKPL